MRFRKYALGYALFFFCSSVCLQLICVRLLEQSRQDEGLAVFAGAVLLMAIGRVFCKQL